MKDIIRNLYEWIKWKRMAKVIPTFPKRGWIKRPFQVRGGENIYIGEGTTINKYAWIDALPYTGMDSVKLVIGENVRLSFNMHIIATHYIQIGNNCNSGNNVYISDNLDSYEDITTPIKNQPIKQLNDVIIGDDTWIGENSCIIGASIGKHCVIGANSVVNHDVPDYCVVVGAPARIIKRYDFERMQWRKTDSKGNFKDD